MDMTEYQKWTELTKKGDVLWALARVCGDIGIDLGDVARMNVDKLEARLAAGTIQGSGDNR